MRLNEPRAALFTNLHQVSISLALQFRVVPIGPGSREWEIQTVAYWYLFFLDDLEAVAYQWDAEGLGSGKVRAPHVHIGRGVVSGLAERAARTRLGLVASSQMPSGLVPFTELLRAAIRDFGVEPIALLGERSDTIPLAWDRDVGNAEAAWQVSFDWYHRSQ